VQEAWAITTKEENWRLRRYNKVDDSMNEVYDFSLGAISLNDLGFKEQVYLIIETKTDEQVFEDYNPRKITVKLHLWRENIFSVMEKKRQPLKIRILDESLFDELHAAIVKASGLQDPLIIRRNFTGIQPITQLDLEANLGKKLIDLRFFNNLTLYVEERAQDGPKWPLEFENEKYRCTIKFNHPRNELEVEEIYFDTRRTLGDLKKHLSELIGIPEDNFRIKRDKNALAEMTTYKKRLSDLRFVAVDTLFLEEGHSSRGSILIHRGEAVLVDDRIDFQVFEEMQFELSQDLNTVEDLIYRISGETGVPAECIRVREYKGFEFKGIFSRGDQIQRIREKSLVWERLEGEAQKGLQIYYRVFNMLQFEFGPLRELYSDCSSSYEELALLIEEDAGIPSDRVLVWKPLSNYIQKEMLLDCDWKEIRYLQRTIRDEPLLINTDGDIIM
jgi:hypothetical protein